jgi:hypothetical protein
LGGLPVAGVPGHRVGFTHQAASRRARAIPPPRCDEGPAHRRRRLGPALRLGPFFIFFEAHYFISVEFSKHKLSQFDLDGDARDKRVTGTASRVQNVKTLLRPARLYCDSMHSKSSSILEISEAQTRARPAPARQQPISEPESW